MRSSEPDVRPVREDVRVRQVPADCRLSCGEHRPYLAVASRPDSEALSLVRCTICGLVFEHPRPDAREIQSFYDRVALWTDSVDPDGRRRSYVREVDAKRPVFADLVRRIERRMRSGTLLDVGCGPGLLEAVLDRSRWSVTGLEPCSPIAEFGRRTLNATILTTSFREARLPSASFDVVVMKYVLDHMEEPFENLLEARRVIKPDGLLVIADVINIDSLCARVFGEGHRLLHRMHFTYFSPATITLHLRRAGFDVTSIEYPYFGTAYFTARGIVTLIARLLRRGVRVLLHRQGAPVLSVPFYGNFMDVWARPISVEAS